MQCVVERGRPNPDPTSTTRAAPSSTANPRELVRRVIFTPRGPHDDVAVAGHAGDQAAAAQHEDPEWDGCRAGHLAS